MQSIDYRLVQAPTLRSGGMKLSVDHMKFVFQSEKNSTT
jgi:hypothetical protein